MSLFAGCRRGVPAQQQPDARQLAVRTPAQSQQQPAASAPQAAGATIGMLRGTARAVATHRRAHVWAPRPLRQRARWECSRSLLQRAAVQQLPTQGLRGPSGRPLGSGSSSSRSSSTPGCRTRRQAHPFSSAHAHLRPASAALRTSSASRAGGGSGGVSGGAQAAARDNDATAAAAGAGAGSPWLTTGPAAASAAVEGQGQLLRAAATAPGFLSSAAGRAPGWRTPTLAAETAAHAALAVPVRLIHVSAADLARVPCGGQRRHKQRGPRAAAAPAPLRARGGALTATSSTTTGLAERGVRL